MTDVPHSIGPVMSVGELIQSSLRRDIGHWPFTASLRLPTASNSHVPPTVVLRNPPRDGAVLASGSIRSCRDTKARFGLSCSMSGTVYDYRGTRMCAMNLPGTGTGNLGLGQLLTSWCSICPCWLHHRWRCYLYTLGGDRRMPLTFYAAQRSTHNGKVKSWLSKTVPDSTVISFPPLQPLRFHSSLILLLPSRSALIHQRVTGIHRVSTEYSATRLLAGSI